MLEVAAALAAAGGVSALALAVVRFALRLGARLPAPSKGDRGIGAPRPAAIAVLAAANDRWFHGTLLALLEGWIVRAGRPFDLRPAEVVALVQLSAAAFLAMGVALSLCLGAWAPPLLTPFGAAYPLLWLRDRIRARRRSIVRALPWAVDLLTLSVEAGLDFTAALAKVVEKGRQGPLGDELSIALKELRLGKTREEALRGLSRRVELPALGSFVQALVHADRMGTPLGSVLRALSTQMRAERTQRAEKLANEAPVKLLLPLIFCIFPTLFLMLFGPIGYQAFFAGSF
ncbi:MAG: type II secretion system F family protein [Myxococcales bacterium]